MNHYLIIDDDEIITLIHPAIIRRVDKDCHIDVAKHSLEAIELLKNLSNQGQKPPDFIFLDINMPLMNGFEFLDLLSLTLKEFLKNSSVVMLTSSANNKDIQKANDYPIIKDFIIKPLSMDYISKIVQKINGSN